MTNLWLTEVLQYNILRTKFQPIRSWNNLQWKLIWYRAFKITLISVHLNFSVFIVPPLTLEERERLYFQKYGSAKSKMAIPLSVLVAMPVLLIVILIIGCVWWREAENRKEQSKEASLIKPKSVHSLPVEKQPLVSSKKESLPSTKEEVVFQWKGDRVT